MAFTVVACSGISSTGKLTAQTGTALLHRCGGEIEACVGARAAALEDAVRHADCILILDGCEDCCGMKKVRALGVEPDLHVVATACGIKKRGMDDPQYAEIECLAAAVRAAMGECRK